MKSHYPRNNEIQRTMIFFVFWISFFTAMYFLAGCESSRHLNKNSIQTEQEKTVDSSSYWKKLYTEFTQTHEEEKKELNSQLQFKESNEEELYKAFENVQDLFIEKGVLTESLNKRIRSIFDSLKNNPCKPQLVVKPDGEIHASGLRSADIGFLSLKSKTEFLERQLAKEKMNSYSLSEKLKKEEKNKTVVVEKKFMSSWWIWYLAGVLSAVLLIVFFIWKNRKAINEQLEADNIHYKLKK